MELGVLGRCRHTTGTASRPLGPRMPKAVLAVLLLELAEAMPHGPDAARRRLTAQTRLGTLLLMTRGYSAPEAGEAWAQAAAMSREAGDAPDVITAMWGMWSFACFRGEFSQALSLAEELLARGEQGGVVQFRLVGHQILATTNWHLGRLADAEEHFSLVTDLIAQLPDDAYALLLDRDPRLSHALFRGIVWGLRGRTDEAAQSFDAGVAASHRTGRPFTVALAHVVAAMGRAIFGDRHAARAEARGAAELASRHGFRQLAPMAAVLEGWADADAAAIREALAKFEALGSGMLLHFFYGLLAGVLKDEGRHAEAMAAVERALAASEATGERFWEAELHRLRAEILLAGPAGRRDEARIEFERARCVAETQGAGLLEERVADSLRRAFGLRDDGSIPALGPLKERGAHS